MPVPEREGSCGAIPFLRWAGGKRWLARSLVEALPRDFGTYFEPFLGSGAIFFRLSPNRARLSDSNLRLIEAYRVVRDRPNLLISELEHFHYNKREFYSVRAERPRTPLGRASQLVYLNRTCWNGLYRVDRNGTFNVPYGKRGDFRAEDRKNVFSASKALQGQDLAAVDFEVALKAVRSGDLVFLDPPYTVTHGNNGFLFYNEKIFSWSDQERLAEVVRLIDKRGARFVLTNANHESILELYRGFQIHPLRRSSILAADPDHRGSVVELVISNHQLELKRVTTPEPH